MTHRATAIAHPNIALVKYWGKRDRALNLPAAGSLSLTLGPVHTRTTVEFHDRSTEVDTLTLDGAPVVGAPLAKVSRFLDRVRSLDPRLGAAEVVSANDFPTAAGLASSSSAFAALAFAATRAADIDLDPSQLSALARQGSGSAARSVFGGFVEMHPGRRTDGADAVASPLFGPEHWELDVVIAVTVTGEKDVSSRDGMNLTEQTSPYFDAWLATVESALAAAREAIGARDFQRLAEVAEASALQMHASAIAAVPGVLYWRGATVELIHAARALREREGVPVFFTIDAGPHVKLFTPRASAARVAEWARGFPGVSSVIHTRPAGGPEYVP